MSKYASLIASFLRLADQGCYRAEIARRLSISVCTVDSWAEIHAITLANGWQGKKRASAEFYRLAHQGYYVTAITRKLGVSPRLVRRWANDLGVVLPDGRRVRWNRMTSRQRSEERQRAWATTFSNRIAQD